MREIRGTTTLVGVLGWPVSHSLSPAMQNAAFEAVGLDWAYVPLPVSPDRLEEAVRGLAASGFAGANVTIPHKTAVVELCDEVDEAAREADSVNTLVFGKGRVLGSSTDVAAVEHSVAPGPGTALVLGAGGSAKAAAAALVRQRYEVAVSSRRDEDWPPVAEEFDVVVNATPVKDSPLVELRAGQLLVDLPYNADGSPTACARAADEAGATVVDGRAILLAQGALSFERWTGRPAPLEAMRVALPGGR
jgi:shikimate dehydrogenase